MAATLTAPADEAVAAAPYAAFSYRVLHDIEAVAPLWAQFERVSPVSPGQAIAFVRHWVAAHHIPRADQFYIVIESSAGPLALLPLWRHRQRGVRTLRFFPGSHVGANQPLVCPTRYAQLSALERQALWSGAARSIRGADLMLLDAVPHSAGTGDAFAQLGTSLPVETLYRAEFANFAEADRVQRSKSRRKHDRQQSEKLEAMGQVGFEAVRNGPEAVALLDVLFSQRARRFALLGIRNPFAEPSVRAFYDAIAAAGSGVDVVLHVLRLDGEPVALRYSIDFAGTLYCLISSMSDEPSIQPGSPGKQCLLRVMQQVFDAGWHAFDMGAGFTDEKRHWCNVQVPLRRHYLALSPIGMLAGVLDRTRIALKRRIKSNPELLAFAKKLRARLVGRTSPVACASEGQGEGSASSH